MTVDYNTLVKLEKRARADQARARAELQALEESLERSREALRREHGELARWSATAEQRCRRGLSPQELRLLENEQQVIRARLEELRREEEQWRQSCQEARTALAREQQVVLQKERSRQRVGEEMARERERREDRRLDELATREFIRRRES